jgi:serine/threonine protein kinase
MDIWALGCCFYEMLTLFPLFPGENEIDQLFKIHEILGSPTPQMLKRFKHLHVHVDFPKKKAINLYHLVPTLSQYGVDLMKKMLMYHPDNRPKAPRLLDHIYFLEIKRQMPLNSFNNRLIYCTKSDNESALGNMGRRRNLQKSNSDSTQASTLRKLEAVDKNLSKQLERCWNMAKCEKKHNIINNIRSSISNQRKAISLNSSFNSVNKQK